MGLLIAGHGLIIVGGDGDAGGSSASAPDPGCAPGDRLDEVLDMLFLDEWMDWFEPDAG